MVIYLVKKSYCKVSDFLGNKGRNRANVMKKSLCIYNYYAKDGPLSANRRHTEMEKG